VARHHKREIAELGALFDPIYEDFGISYDAEPDTLADVVSPFLNKVIPLIVFSDISRDDFGDLTRPLEDGTDD